MPLIQDAVQVAAAPAQDRHQLRIELAGEALELADRDRGDPAPLDERHQALRDASPCAEIGLAPAEAVAQGAEASAESRVVHCLPMMAGGGYLAIIQQLDSS